MRATDEWVVPNRWTNGGLTTVWVCLPEDKQRRSQVKLGSAADFSLDINETDLSLLTASIRAPSGKDEPCLLKRMANNHIGETASTKSKCRHFLSPS